VPGFHRMLTAKGIDLPMDLFGHEGL